MAAFNGRIAQEMAEWERQKRLKRKQIRNERIVKQKEENHRNFIFGKLVSKYFPEEASKYKPTNNTEENNIIFQPVESFLSILASDKELMARLKDEVALRLADSN